MSGNARGKLKEHFEGIHRDFDWVLEHCQKMLALIEDKNPPLTEAITALAKQTQTLDELASGLYDTI